MACCIPGSPTVGGPSDIPGYPMVGEPSGIPRLSYGWRTLGIPATEGLARLLAAPDGG